MAGAAPAERGVVRRATPTLTASAVPTVTVTATATPTPVSTPTATPTVTPTAMAGYRFATLDNANDVTFNQTARHQQTPA